MAFLLINKMIDKDIVQKFVAGNVKAFEKIFREYARGMQLIALGIYKDADVAEDAVQETFVYLWNHRGVIKSGESLEGYLYTSVKHYVLNHLRHQHIRLAKEEDIAREQEWLGHQSPEEHEDIEEKIKTVRSVIDLLPESCRKIFVMTVIEGMSYADAADELGISLNTVKSQVKIAYKKIKNTVQENPDNMYYTALFLLSLKKIL